MNKTGMEEETRGESPFPVLIASFLLYVSKHWLQEGRHLLPSRIRQACRMTASEHHSGLLMASTRRCVRNLPPSLALGAMISLAWQSVYLLFTQRMCTQITAHQGEIHRIPKLRLSRVDMRMLIVVMPSVVQKWKPPPCFWWLVY